MIVKCEKCQTRFKIPDEKVTDKGVKVRCTKCQNTFRVTKSADPATMPAVALMGPPAPDADPFSQFGGSGGAPAAEPTRRQSLTDIAAAHTSGQRPLAPSFDAQSDLPSELFKQPTRVGPAPTRPVAAAPPLASFDPSDPFAPPAAVARINVARMPASQARSATPPEAQAVPAAAADSQPEPQEGLGAFGEDSKEDLFGKTNTTLMSQPLPAPGEATDLGGAAAPDRALFDMPEPPAPTHAADAGNALADADHDLPTSTSQRRESVDVSGIPAPVVERPAGRPEDVGMAEVRKIGAVRRTAGLVVNLALATVLVLALISVGTIYLNEGKLDVSALSLDPVKALFTAPSDLVAAEVSNGLYDTNGARQVFYVRGEVENRSAKATRVKVRVEIVDGPMVIATAQTLAGQAPTPEELYSVTSAEQLAALGAHLDQGSAEVKPNGRVPFLVGFYEYPPSLTDYRLKVIVEEAPAPGATATR